MKEKKLPKQVTSYAVKIVQERKLFAETITIYRQALAYVIPFVNQHYEEWKEIKGANQRSRYMEILLHGTSTQDPLYDFDQRFYKYPSYLRRSTILKAIGIVSSYRSNYQNWLDKGEEGQAPSLQTKHEVFPTLYLKNMFEFTSAYEARIKVYHQNDWVFKTIRLRKSDSDYLARHKGHLKKSAPTLERAGKGYALRFAFEEGYELPSEAYAILSVDLGVNTDATAVAMCPDGTILGRHFIKRPSDKDQMYRVLNRIKRNQQRGNRGKRANARYWTRVKGLNNHIADSVSKELVELATFYGAIVIVFEHLDTKSKKKGSKKQRLHHWNHKRLLATTTSKAHLAGIRIARINAWNTSRLAHDGSGRVLRGREIDQPYGLVQFQNGKLYNADLNAAYNIGARYCIKQILKSLPAKEESEVLANVPGLSVRITRTLADLIRLNTVLGKQTLIELLG